MSKDAKPLNPLPTEYERIAETISDVMEFAAAKSPAFAALRAHLKTLEDLYLQDLRTVRAEELQSLQGKLAQLEAIRLLLEGQNLRDGRA